MVKKWKNFLSCKCIEEMFLLAPSVFTALIVSVTFLPLQVASCKWYSSQFKWFRFPGISLRNTKSRIHSVSCPYSSVLPSGLHELFYFTKKWQKKHCRLLYQGDQTTSPQTHCSTPENQLLQPGLSSPFTLKGEGTLLWWWESHRAG